MLDPRTARPRFDCRTPTVADCDVIFLCSVNGWWRGKKTREKEKCNAAQILAERCNGGGMSAYVYRVMGVAKEGELQVADRLEFTWLAFRFPANATLIG